MSFMGTRIAALAIVAGFLIASPSFAAKKDDLCREEGIIVKNLTAHNLWYKQNGKDGACYIWIKDHIFVIKPGESIGIFSDMTCQKRYCPKNPEYKDYKAADRDRDCRVRILPGCKLSDM